VGDAPFSKGDKKLEREKKTSLLCPRERRRRNIGGGFLLLLELGKGGGGGDQGRGKKKKRGGNRNFHSLFIKRQEGKKEKGDDGWRRSPWKGERKVWLPSSMVAKEKGR